MVVWDAPVISVSWLDVVPTVASAPTEDDPVEAASSAELTVPRVLDVVDDEPEVGAAKSELGVLVRETLSRQAWPAITPI